MTVSACLTDDCVGRPALSAVEGTFLSDAFTKNATWNDGRPRPSIGNHEGSRVASFLRFHALIFPFMAARITCPLILRTGTITSVRRFIDQLLEDHFR